MPLPLADAQQQFFSGLRSVFSEVNILDRLGWSAPRFWINGTVIIVVAAVMIILIVLGFRKMVRRGREILGRSETLFSEYSGQCKLTDEEADFLKSLAQACNVAQPHVLFQALPLFEQCVDAHVRAFLESRPGPEEIAARGAMLKDLRGKLGFHHLPLEYPLASTRNISIGQAGSLFSKNDNRPIFRKVSVVGNTPFFLTLKYNVDKEEIRRVAEGAIVRFAFARQSDGLYGFQATVARAEAGSIDVYHTTEIKRNQLRQYVRIETSLPLRFRLIQTQDPEKSEVKRGELLLAKLADVSGGGLSFMYERSLRLGDIVSLNFDLPGAPCAGIIGKIVHLSLREGKEGPQFKNHVQFVTIEPRKREKIISYIFEKERQISQWR